MLSPFVPPSHNRQQLLTEAERLARANTQDRRAARCRTCYGRGHVQMWPMYPGDQPLRSDGQGGYQGRQPEHRPCRCQY